MLTITGRDGVTRNATQLVQSITWGGDIRQCARTLDMPLLSDPMDESVPELPCPMGSGVSLSVGGKDLFSGYVFSRQRDTGQHTIDLGCVDRGLYLKRNEGHYKFNGQTAEEIARIVCSDFGISVGVLAQTGVRLRRNFPGTSLYQIIQTAYTLAAEATGERYAIRFRGEKLEVLAKKQDERTLVLEPGSNLLSTTVSESVEDMVNQVAIYNENGVLVSTEKDNEAIRLYGLMQAYLKREKGRDVTAEAKSILDDNGVEQKITVTLLGNSGLLAGGSVVMREPVTGLYGLFWIDSDTHTWKNGIYQTKLVLSFRNMMDEQTAGSLPKA